MEGVNRKVKGSHVFVVTRGEIGDVTEDNEEYQKEPENIPFLQSCGNFFFHINHR